MKYIYTMLIGMLMISGKLWANPDSLELTPTRLQLSFDTKCDVCGCGSGNYYMGVMPQLAKSFVGLRYRTQSFDSHLKRTLQERTQETFNTVELWGRFYPVNRLQVLVFVPYSFNEQKTAYMNKEIQGIGDASVLVNYNVWQNTSADSTQKKWKHTLWLGGGVKLPTGEFSYDEVDFTQVSNPNFQLGTGSVDVLLNLLYSVRYDRIGLSIDATYKMNTENRERYQFGNKVSGSANLFFIQKLGKAAIMPSVGVYTEYAGKDKRRQQSIEETGGTATLANMGVDFYYRFVAIGYTYQEPIAQNLAQGEIEAHQRQMLHLTFMF